MSVHLCSPRDIPAQSQEREICPVHAIHVHTWWLFPLLLLGIGHFEADEADVAYVFGLVALIGSRLVAAITPEF